MLRARYDTFMERNQIHRMLSMARQLFEVVEIVRQYSNIRKEKEAVLINLILEMHSEFRAPKLQREICRFL